jgi:hypothetical protein
MAETPRHRLAASLRAVADFSSDPAACRALADSVRPVELADDVEVLVACTDHGLAARLRQKVAGSLVVATTGHGFRSLRQDRDRWTHILIGPDWTRKLGGVSLGQGLRFFVTVEDAVAILEGEPLTVDDSFLGGELPEFGD